jgi:glycine cleavage system H protein
MANEFPDDVRYTGEHEWARGEGEVVRVGITFYAQDALGDVVYVELPDVGTVITQDAPFGEIQSPKAVSDLYAPVSGEILERNEDALATPELVNEDPYGEGWLVVIRPSDRAELDRLMDAKAYAELVASLSDEV